MKITKNNLDEVMFENQDARLLIEDVVAHTGANLYYYHDQEITVQKALGIWYKAQAAETCDGACGLSFLDSFKSRMDIRCFLTGFFGQEDEPSELLRIC